MRWLRDFKLATVLCTLLVTGASTCATETVRLAVGEWAPYTSQTDLQGKLLEEVTARAFKLEGIAVQFTYYPWKRSYLLAASGEYDGTLPWNKSPERNQLFFFPNASLVKDENVFFHLKTTSFDWTRLDDLRNYRVGVTIGYQEEASYKAAGISAEAVSSEELNFRKMRIGRLDVYQTSKHVGYDTLAKLFGPVELGLFTHHPKVVYESEYYVLFSKKTKRGKFLADRFDSGLKKLKDSGEYDKILAKLKKAPR